MESKQKKRPGGRFSVSKKSFVGKISELPTPHRKRGDATDLWARGILKGFASRAGARACPLRRLLWVLSCRNKKVPPPAGTGTFNLVERVLVKVKGITLEEACDIYRILDYLPHSSSAPSGHLPPGGRDCAATWAELLAFTANRVLDDRKGRPYSVNFNSSRRDTLTIHYSLFIIQH